MIMIASWISIINIFYVCQNANHYYLITNNHRIHINLAFRLLTVLKTIFWLHCAKVCVTNIGSKETIRFWLWKSRLQKTFVTLNHHWLTCWMTGCCCTTIVLVNTPSPSVSTPQTLSGSSYKNVKLKYVPTVSLNKIAVLILQARTHS